MESTEYTLDGLLCQSILLFHQSRFYDTCRESETEAFQLLEQARLVMRDTQSCVDMAKWGCTFECLAQKYYINGDTDGVLEEIDTALASFWKRIEASRVETFAVYLWLGYYFLLRFRNGASNSRGRCKRVMSDILSYLTETFRKVRKKPALMNTLPDFSADVWGETVYWVEVVHGSCLCEKQAVALLKLLYDFKQMELTRDKVEQDMLLQRILEFYSF